MGAIGAHPSAVMPMGWALGRAVTPKTREMVVKLGDRVHRHSCPAVRILPRVLELQQVPLQSRFARATSWLRRRSKSWKALCS